jgi:hypothetical protein
MEAGPSRRAAGEPPGDTHRQPTVRGGEHTETAPDHEARRVPGAARHRVRESAEEEHNVR